MDVFCLKVRVRIERTGQPMVEEEGRPKRQRNAVPRYDPDQEKNRAQWGGTGHAAKVAGRVNSRAATASISASLSRPAKQQRKDPPKTSPRSRNEAKPRRGEPKACPGPNPGEDAKPVHSDDRKTSPKLEPPAVMETEPADQLVVTPAVQQLPAVKAALAPCPEPRLEPDAPPQAVEKTGTNAKAASAQTSVDAPVAEQSRPGTVETQKGGGAKGAKPQQAAQVRKEAVAVKVDGSAPLPEPEPGARLGLANKCSMLTFCCCFCSRNGARPRNRSCTCSCDGARRCAGY